MSLRNSSYPFDWLRTSMLGLVEDFRTDFLSLWEDMEGESEMMAGAKRETEGSKLPGTPTRYYI